MRGFADVFGCCSGGNNERGERWELVAQHVETINRAAKAAKLMASRVCTSGEGVDQDPRKGGMARLLALAPTGHRQ